MTTIDVTEMVAQAAVATADVQVVVAPAVDGWVVWSNRGLGEPSNIAVASLDAALKAVGGENLIDLLPPAIGVGQAMLNACSRVSGDAARCGMEWREAESRDSAGNRVMALAEVTVDGKAMTASMNAKAFVLIDAVGKATPVYGATPIFNPLVDGWVSSYKKELGVMGSTQLWETASRIALRKGGGFKLSPGQFFVSGENADHLLLLDAALKAIGSHYRLRRMRYDTSTQNDMADDAAHFLKSEAASLRDRFAALKEAAKQRGKPMGEATIENYDHLLADLTASVDLMRAIMKNDVVEFDAMYEELADMIADASIERRMSGK